MDFSKYTVVELKSKLRTYGLKISGKKTELVKRLNDHCKSSSNCAGIELHSQYKLRNLSVRLTRIDISKVLQFSSNVGEKSMSTQFMLNSKRELRSNTKIDEMNIFHDNPSSLHQTTKVDLHKGAVAKQLVARTSQQSASNISNQASTQCMLNSKRVLRSNTKIDKMDIFHDNPSSLHQTTKVDLHNGAVARQLVARTSQQSACNISTLNETRKKHTRNMDEKSPPRKHRRISTTAKISKDNIAKKKCRRSRKIVTNVVSLIPALLKYEIVWAKMRGFPLWPGIIENETPKGKYVIHFFGDYTFYEISRNNLQHLLEGFTTYARSEKPTIKLQKAVRECQLFLFDKNASQSCYICDMLKMKALIKNH